MSPELAGSHREGEPITLSDPYRMPWNVVGTHRVLPQPLPAQGTQADVSDGSFDVMFAPVKTLRGTKPSPAAQKNESLAWGEASSVRFHLPRAGRDLLRGGRAPSRL